VRVLRYPAALAGVLGLVALTALALSWPFEKAVLAYWVLGLGLLVALTVLGVKLPNEGG
jgi:hypothetical protein